MKKNIEHHHNITDLKMNIAKDIAYKGLILTLNNTITEPTQPSEEWKKNVEKVLIFISSIPRSDIDTKFSLLDELYSILLSNFGIRSNVNVSYLTELLKSYNLTLLFKVNINHHNDVLNFKSAEDMFDYFEKKYPVYINALNYSKNLSSSMKNIYHEFGSMLTTNSFYGDSQYLYSIRREIDLAFMPLLDLSEDENLSEREEYKDEALKIRSFFINNIIAILRKKFAENLNQNDANFDEVNDFLNILENDYRTIVRTQETMAIGVKEEILQEFCKFIVAKLFSSKKTWQVITTETSLLSTFLNFYTIYVKLTKHENISNVDLKKIRKDLLDYENKKKYIMDKKFINLMKNLIDEINYKMDESVKNTGSTENSNIFQRMIQSFRTIFEKGDKKPHKSEITNSEISKLVLEKIKNSSQLEDYLAWSYININLSLLRSLIPDNQVNNPFKNVENYENPYLLLELLGFGSLNKNFWENEANQAKSLVGSIKKSIKNKSKMYYILQKYSDQYSIGVSDGVRALLFVPEFNGEPEIYKYAFSNNCMRIGIEHYLKSQYGELFESDIINENMAISSLAGLENIYEAQSATNEFDKKIHVNSVNAQNFLIAGMYGKFSGDLSINIANFKNFKKI